MVMSGMSAFATATRLDWRDGQMGYTRMQDAGGVSRFLQRKNQEIPIKSGKGRVGLDVCRARLQIDFDSTYSGNGPQGLRDTRRAHGASHASNHQINGGHDSP
jgi:hypothetical protein